MVDGENGDNKSNDQLQSSLHRPTKIDQLRIHLVSTQKLRIRD